MVSPNGKKNQSDSEYFNDEKKFKHKVEEFKSRFYSTI